MAGPAPRSSQYRRATVSELPNPIQLPFGAQRVPGDRADVGVGVVECGLQGDRNVGITCPSRQGPHCGLADIQVCVAARGDQGWPNTAIFVTEDDAQDGPDHIDAHRTLAEVISPYTHTGRVDSTFYSTASMLRTIELIVGLRPLTRFDAYATPMPAAFTNKPDLTPYTALQPTQNMQEVNPVNAPFAAQSQNQDLTKEDQINMHQFNEATWASIKGAIIPMPAPPTQRVPRSSGRTSHDDTDPTRRYRSGAGHWRRRRSLTLDHQAGHPWDRHRDANCANRHTSATPRRCWPGKRIL
jgi:hypothetical protein